MSTFHEFSDSLIGKRIKWEFINYFGDVYKTIIGTVLQNDGDSIYCRSDDECDYWLLMKDLELHDARFDTI